jgi:hypothetical protein
MKLVIGWDFVISQIFLLQVLTIVSRKPKKAPKDPKWDHSENRSTSYYGESVTTVELEHKGLIQEDVFATVFNMPSACLDSQPEFFLPNSTT